MKKQNEKAAKRECLECHRPFVPKRHWQKFCNVKGRNCRINYWTKTHPRMSSTAPMQSESAS